MSTSIQKVLVLAVPGFFENINLTLKKETIYWLFLTVNNDLI
jgi:hypothetical protein